MREPSPEGWARTVSRGCPRVCRRFFRTRGDTSPNTHHHSVHSTRQQLPERIAVAARQLAAPSRPCDWVLSLLTRPQSDSTSQILFPTPPVIFGEVQIPGSVSWKMAQTVLYRPWQHGCSTDLEIWPTWHGSGTGYGQSDSRKNPLFPYTELIPLPSQANCRTP